MSINKNIVKFIVVIVLTVATTIGSGIVAEQVGINIASIAYAGCTSGGGGGC